MSAPNPILINLTGATFPIQNETGGLTTSFDRKTGSKLEKIYDGQAGATTGMVFHDFMADYDINVMTIGTAGLPAAAPGVAYSVLNVATGNGVTAGGIYVTQTNLKHTAGTLQQFSVTAVQYPGIT